MSDTSLPIILLTGCSEYRSIFPLPWQNEGGPENANNEQKVTIQEEKCLANVNANSITNG